MSNLEAYLAYGRGKQGCRDQHSSCHDSKKAARVEKMLIVGSRWGKPGDERRKGGL